MARGGVPRRVFCDGAVVEPTRARAFAGQWRAVGLPTLHGDARVLQAEWMTYRYEFLLILYGGNICVGVPLFLE